MTACVKRSILTLERGNNYASQDVKRLTHEVFSLREQVIALEHLLLFEKCLGKMNRVHFEDRSKGRDKRLICSPGDIVTCPSSLKRSIDCYNSSCSPCSPLMTDRRPCAHLTVGHADRCIQSLECTLRKTECELEGAIKKIRCLELDKSNLNADLEDCRRENQCIQEKVSCLCRERDCLLEKLDRKTVEVCSLQKENNDKANRINCLEQTITRLNCEMKALEHEAQRADQKICCLKKDLKDVCDCKDKLMCDNRRLQNDLNACCNENEFKDNELRCLKEEMCCVKSRLCECCEDVKRLECCLEEKEREKQILCEELKKLSDELMNVDMSREGLQGEVKNTSAKLCHFEDKCKNLESGMMGKEGQCQQMEQEVCALKRDINELKKETSCLCQKNIVLKHELDVAYDLCNTLEHQKQQCCCQLRELEEVQKKLNYDIAHAQAIIEQLKCQLQAERKNVCALENLITETRKEAMEERMQNHALCKRIKELESTIERLCAKINGLKECLCKAQKCCEAGEIENARIKRELHDFRFGSARR